MNEPSPSSERPEPFDRLAAAVEARRLIRAAAHATLATSDHGAPFASLVTPGHAPDLSPLLFISRLSAHTRHLAAEPRCALLYLGSPAGRNPQTAPRVTVSAIATPTEDAALKARWLARHPYAALYAGFTDFGLWRLTITGAHLVGGFARALHLGAQELAPPPDAVTAIAEAAGEIIAHCNKDHPNALETLAGSLGFRMVSVDADGCDLASGEDVRRYAWEKPVSNPGELRKALIKLIRKARGADA
jgi:putative heme iron utilization protein